MTSTVAERTEIALFVSREHALAKLRACRSAGDLEQHRELRLATIVNPYDSRGKGRVWSAPSYLMLLEMAERALAGHRRQVAGAALRQ